MGLSVTWIERTAFKVTKYGLKALYREYLRSSAYLRHIGIQAQSGSYGGSRSRLYHHMLQQAETFADLKNARAQYRSFHAEAESSHDENGALWRILAYRLRGVPVLGSRLEEKQYIDDPPMAQAEFAYPEFYHSIPKTIDVPFALPRAERRDHEPEHRFTKRTQIVSRI